ncbi:hypothetical protein [Enterococcus faecalis]|nr:hypothetical protein [Enterococcus faecalis]
MSMVANHYLIIELYFQIHSRDLEMHIYFSQIGGTAAVLRILLDNS